MAIKDTSKRISITCDEFMLNRFNCICEKYNLSYTQLFSLFADYLVILDIFDDIDFYRFLAIHFTEH